ncbi:MAG: Ig-like domain repeat protein, partial [Candidatus Bathyarchaeia archaeon]
NDVVYLVTTEHTPETPLFKGGLARAINATTGKEIWTISEYTGEFQVFSYAAADGYNTWFNGYDAQIYVVGRGPSQTTVTAPNAGLASGQPVVIRGTVTDVSAGTKQNEQASNFPNGVPVCSDASMQAWMGYVYQQQPEPTNFTGVPVNIYVLDSNHNYRQIGTATTNENGMYTLTWTPDIAGNYTVYANFAGTNGYWPSSDTTSFTAMQASATAAPTATPLSGVATQTALEYGIVAIIIVIIIIGAVLALLLTRKHP